MNNEHSETGIKSGAPQGSVIGPILYTLFTSDMTCNSDITIATYDDDIAILASNVRLTEAFIAVHNQLSITNLWMKNWNVKLNSDKSVHLSYCICKWCYYPFIHTSKIPRIIY